MSAEVIDAGLVAEEEAEFLADVVPQFLTFLLRGEVYGISIAHVAEIIGAQRLTPVPDSRLYMRGVINLRGTVIPVMDVRTRLEIEPRESDDRTCIVVVRHDEMVVGLMVDTICDVIDVLPNQIESAPRGKSEAAIDSIVTGLVQLDGEVKILINVERLLHSGLEVESDPETEER